MACGAVLSQKGSDSLWHPVAYMSKSFIEAERNYNIYDRELLAIICALEEWRYYLEGSPHPIEILSDHKNLEIFKEARKLSRRQARWSLYLSRFNFTITHVSGTMIGKPDALSRRTDHDTGDSDNKDCVLLPDSLFTRSTTTILLENQDLQQRIKKNCQAIDAEINNILQIIQAKNTPAKLRNHYRLWEVIDGLILYDQKVYVPHDPDLQRDVTALCHDMIVAGHPGRVKTLDLVQRQFWWSGMRKFIFAYVDGCATCQSTKNLPNRPVTPLHPIPPNANTTPFSTVSMDFITELPPSLGFDAITVFVDHDVTKATVIVPCSTTITAEQTAQLYQDHVWRRFGLPKKLISDRGTQFTALFTKELCRLLGITQAMSMANHPQSDGQTKCLNQELEQYLRVFCNLLQTDWASYLSTAKFAHNSRSHSTIETSPFFALIGYHPSGLPPVSPVTSVPSVSDRVSSLQHLRSDLLAAQSIAHHQWSSSLPYKVGDLVWLKGKHLRTSHPSAKLAPRRYGPFPILSSIHNVTFKLRLPPTSKIHPVFHTSLLSPYRETDAHGPNFLRPAPDLLDGDEHFEVESILDSRFYRRSLQYLVHWKGYPSSDDQWLPAPELSNALDLVSTFHLSHPTAPSPN
jgi:RNase H-like domain found in reverse transcriptase/Integrase zinc binding domain/Chromo (CHRromatin Organisation MOdifier) domain/Integrase core domain